MRISPTTGRDLLALVSQVPDDDAPRLAYADHVEPYEPDYAEFVRLQVGRTRDERTRGALTGKWSAREEALFHAHRLEWPRYFEKYVRRSPSDEGWAFERGFIVFARLEPENFVGLGERLFMMAPIQHADLHSGAAPVRPLFDSPHLARLDSLSLAGNGIDDDDAEAMAASPHMQRMVWLDLSYNDIGSRGAEALARSPYFADKARVIMTGNPGDPVDRPSYDYDGSLADVVDSVYGAAIESKLGRRVSWFHPTYREVADRYHARWVKRV